MALNRECYYKSLKSDGRIIFTICGLIIIAILCFAIGYSFIIMCGPIIFGILSPIMKFVFEALGTPYWEYMLICLIVLGVHFVLLVNIERSAITKYSTVILASLMMSVICLFYLAYSIPNSVPLCDNTRIQLMCRIKDVALPSVTTETIVMCIWLWVSTPLIIAYKRCKE